MGSGVTSVSAEATLLIDVAVGLTLSPSFAVGGVGHLVPSAIALGEIEFRDVELDVGYGGLFGRFEHPAPFGGGAWYGELLLGVGNGDVRERGTGLHLDSDNFFVLQPALGLAVDIGGPFSASAAVSYRSVSGVEDLRGVRPADLRAVSLHLRLRLDPL